MNTRSRLPTPRALENACEPVGELLETPVSVRLPVPVPALPDQRRPVSETAVGVAVDSLVGDVEPTAGQPLHPVVHLCPEESRLGLGVFWVSRQSVSCSPGRVVAVSSRTRYQRRGCLYFRTAIIHNRLLPLISRPAPSFSVHSTVISAKGDPCVTFQARQRRGSEGSSGH